jgi:hypothetical protein
MRDIQKYNKGIQFVNGIYETDDITVINSLINYTQSFINKGVQPYIWSEGQEILLKADEVEEEPVTNTSEHKKMIQDIESFLRQ